MEDIRTPIQLMGDLLVEMTARAMEAERQRDEALRSSDDWYHHWKRRDDDAKEAEAKLAAEIAEHQALRDSFRDYVAKHEEEAKNG